MSCSLKGRNFQVSARQVRPSPGPDNPEERSPASIARRFTITEAAFSTTGSTSVARIPSLRVLIAVSGANEGDL